MNDPNGLIHYRGRHHLFFQHNPQDVVMGTMCWGHVSSTDLLTWRSHPLALVPGSDGPYDEDGCWSGCAVRDGDRVIMLYSGNRGGIQLPCLARSDDGDLNDWAKWVGNPVIAERPPVAGLTEMRDHSVRRDGRQWRQVLAGGVKGEGVLFGYSSTDLHRWSWDGMVLRAGDLDLPGAVWECPDLFETDDGAIAIVSVMDESRPRVIWVHGELQGFRLVPDSWGELDAGDRLYAPQTYLDESGRRLLFGWLTAHRDPASVGRPSVGIMSIPRQVTLRGGRLWQTPAAELESCRRSVTTGAAQPGQKEAVLSLPGDSAFELHVSASPAGDVTGLVVELIDDNGRSLIVRMDGFGPPDGRPEDAAEMRLFFDAGIVEVFSGDGRAAAWTDLGLAEVQRIRVRRDPAASRLTLTHWHLAPPTTSAPGRW